MDGGDGETGRPIGIGTGLLGLTDQVLLANERIWMMLELPTNLPTWSDEGDDEQGALLCRDVERQEQTSRGWVFVEADAAVERWSLGASAASSAAAPAKAQWGEGGSNPGSDHASEDMRAMSIGDYRRTTSV